MTDFQQIDLAELAVEQFAAAVSRCGAFRSYHALWPYLRLTHWVGGIEADQAQLVPILSSLLSVAPQRVLIAGSADTGVTALVHHAAGQMAKQHQITVADRCATPLQVCSTYATRHGLTLTCLPCDLRELTLHDEFDVVVGHSILPWLDPAGRQKALRNLRQALVLGGHMVLNTRLGLPGQSAGKGARPAGWAQEMQKVMLSQFAKLNIVCPCPLEEFGAIVKTYAPPDFNASYADQAALEADLNDAGFEVEKWAASGKGLAYMTDGSVKTSMRQGWVAVARAK